MRLLAVWIINALALPLVAYLLKSIHTNGLGSALIAALMLGPVDMLTRPVLVIFILPIILLILELLIFIINVLLFLFVGNLLAGSQAVGFGAALLGSIPYNVILWLLLSLLLCEA